VVTLDSLDKEALNRLGAAYAQAGRADEARSAFERALAIDPAFARARRNLDRLAARERPDSGK